MASLRLILAQEMRGADGDAAGPGHASGTLVLRRPLRGSQSVIDYIGSKRHSERLTKDVGRA
jgi:hypothetical protein